MQKYTVKYRGNPKLFANLKKLEIVQPRLVKRLRAFIKKGGSGFQWTLEDTASGSWIHGLTEEPFFEHATAPYAAEIRHQGYPITYFMGRGSRRYLKQAMEAAPADTKYYVFVETRLEPVIDTLCALDLEDSFFEKKAVLFLVDDERGQGSLADIETFYFQRGTYIGSYFNIMAHRALCEGNADAYRKRLKNLVDEVEFRAMLLGNSGEDTMWGFRQAVLNTAWMVEREKLQTLRPLLSGRPFVVVAAGPSLDKNVHLLKGMEDKVIIAAVDTVVGKLLRMGIRPHFVTVLERVFGIYDKYISPVVDRYREELRDVVMVSQAVCVNLIAGRWPGPVAVVSKTGLELDERFLTRTMNVPRIESGGSSAHMCLGIAHFFNASSVALIGQDLAYGEDGRTHTLDTAWDKTGGDEKNMDRITVPGWHGAPVQTCDIWKFFIDAYNDMLRRIDSPVFDCTEGGALIEGTRKAFFADWLEKNALAEPLRESALRIGQAVRSKEHNVAPAFARERIAFFRERFDESVRYLDLASEALAKVEDEASKEENLPGVEEMQHALDRVHIGNELLQLVGQAPFAMLRSEWHIVRDMENPKDLREWKEIHRDFFEAQRIACNFHIYWLDYMLRTLEMMEKGEILPGYGSVGPLSAEEGLPLTERIILQKELHADEMEQDVRLDNVYARCGKLSASWAPDVFRSFSAHFQRSGRMTEAQSLMTLAVRFTEGRPVSRADAFNLLRDWAMTLSFADLCGQPYTKKAYEALKDAAEYAPDTDALSDLLSRLLRIRKNALQEAREHSRYPAEHPLMVELENWIRDLALMIESVEEGEDTLALHTPLLDKLFGLAAAALPFVPEEAVPEELPA